MVHERRYLALLAAVTLCAGCQIMLGLDDTRPRVDDGADAAADGAADADCGDAGCADGWWDASFTRRRKLRIEAGKVGEDLSNLPVLVVLDPERVTYAEAGADGASLRFIAADHATELAHEIEAWQVDGTSHVWVLVPLVPAGGVDLWMYYGNAAAEPGQRPADLWQGAGYESVHHLHDGYQDSSGKGHDGTAGGQPDRVSGTIGNCYDFNGVDEYVELAGESSFDFRTALSVEAWIYVDELDIQYQPVVTKGDDSWRLHRAGTDSVLAMAVTDSASQVSVNAIMQTMITTGQWRHVAAVYDGQQLTAYLDGAVDGTGGYSGMINDSNAPVRIGHNSQRIDRYFDGRIDELRLAPVPRTPAWIAAAYQAVADASFITYAATDEVGPY